MAILCLGLAGLSGWILSRRIEIFPRVLVALIISTAFLVCPAQLLGLLQIFSWGGRIGFVDLVLVEILLFTAALAVCPKRRLPSKVEPSSTIRLPIHLKFSGALLAGTYVLLALDLLTSFPGGWDALCYHFPISLRLLQEGTLGLPVSKVWQLSLPANAEIGMAILLGTGYQSLAPAINWLAVVVVLYAAYIIGLEICGNRAVALAAVVMVLSIPIVQFQAFSGYIDLFATAFLLAAVALFLQSRSLYSLNPDDKQNRLGASIVSGLACGISMGSKPTFFLFGGVFYLLVVLASVWDSRRLGERLGHSLLLISLFTAAIAVPTVFWLVRGMEAAQNPVYPIRVALGDRVVFEGYRSEQVEPPEVKYRYVRSPHEWLIYPWTESTRARSWDQMPYGTNTGYGAMFATFVPLGMAFVSREQVRGRLKKSSVILLIVFLVLLAAWWFILMREPRYGLPLWVLACCLTTPLLQLLDGSVSRAFRVLFVCSLASTCLITSSRPVLNILGRIRNHGFSRASIYEYPPIIDRLPAGSRVLNYSQSYNNNFALAGATLGNRVIPYFALPAPPGGKLEIDPVFRGRSLSEDVLQEYQADYIIEQLDDWKSSPNPPASGLSLISDTVLNLGDEGKKNRWRIWQVQKKP